MICANCLAGVIEHIMNRGGGGVICMLRAASPCQKMRKVPKGDYESVCAPFVKSLLECIEKYTNPVLTCSAIPEALLKEYEYPEEPVKKKSGLRPIVKSRREMY